MSDDNKKPEECEGIRQYKETAKEIKEIRELINKINGNSDINKISLKNLTVSFKNFAETNRLTHIQLFARTENIKINMAKVETSHKEHVKHGDKGDDDKRHRVTFLLSCVAVCVSIVTVYVLAKQAGLF